MRVCVVGSRTFPLTPEVGGEVVDILRAYPAGTVFLTRGSEGFDQFLMAVCGVVGYDAVAYHSGGGAANFLRDVKMVEDADEVIAFLDPATLHDMNTGTAHVCEKALDQRKPLRAFSVAHNRLVYAGSTE